MNFERIPAMFFTSAEWLEHYAHLTGRESPEYLELIDVNHLVPPFSIHRTFLAQLIFRAWVTST